MTLTKVRQMEERADLGWHSRGYLPHFDGIVIPQFVTSRLADSLPWLLSRKGPFWMKEYFDRYIRNDKHFRNVVKYIEENPVKARLCAKPSDWPFSSAWFREHGEDGD